MVAGSILKTNYTNNALQRTVGIAGPESSRLRNWLTTGIPCLCGPACPYRAALENWVGGARSGSQQKSTTPIGVASVVSVLVQEAALAPEGMLHGWREPDRLRPMPNPVFWHGKDRLACRARHHTAGERIFPSAIASPRGYVRLHSDRSTEHTPILTHTTLADFNDDFVARTWPKLVHSHRLTKHRNP